MPKKLWLLVMGMFINVTGASFIWPLNTIYIHYHLGKALAVAGFVLTLNSFASVVGSLLGGYLFDRIGSYRTVVQGVVLTLAAATVLAFNHDWWFYVVCLIVMGLGSGMVVPSIYASAGLIWPSGGSKTFAAIYVAQNAGVALGSALGGISLHIHSTIYSGEMPLSMPYLLCWWCLHSNVFQRPQVQSAKKKRFDKNKAHLVL
ncbi:MFS transporter [Paenibacillus larvae]|nr:MFS transporter [Paenibacillus larvae]MDT2254988.1 MFS transporter [Paenibacillus larvae]